MTEERSPKYGITDSTSKPVALACWDLSTAIKTLDKHHELERPAFERALESLTASIDDANQRAATALRAHVQRLEGIAVPLREARAALRDELLNLWPALEDLAAEENSLRHPNRVQLAEEAALTERPPAPIHGIEPDLPSNDWLRVVATVVKWSREISYGTAARALGPCYLLSKVIEHPKSQARGLRDVCGEAVDHIHHFLAERHTS